MEANNGFTELVDLAASRLGGGVIAANDEFFAPKESLLLEHPAVWKEGVYTERGKWMDGWETRRRRYTDFADWTDFTDTKATDTDYTDPDAFDWCIIRLGLPGIVRGVVVDTSFFRGNYPESCSIEACAFKGVPSLAELASAPWRELLSRSQLQGDTHNEFAVISDERVTHLRFNIFPDGGVARLRVHGEVAVDWPRLAKRGQIDLAAVEQGGRVIAASDMFFGHRHNLIMPGRGINMGDGWETKRRRGPGNDWVIVKLGRAGSIERLIIDTIHFKGNAPGTCRVEACSAPNAGDVAPDNGWVEVLPMTPLQPDSLHEFEDEMVQTSRHDFTHVRLSVYPDGGVSRFRVFGKWT